MMPWTKDGTIRTHQVWRKKTTQVSVFVQDVQVNNQSGIESVVYQYITDKERKKYIFPRAWFEEGFELVST